MIRVEGLSIRSASGTRLLDDVSFTAEPGTLTAITGPSGSGKTLLLWSLIGHMPAKAERSGTVLVGGRSVPELRRDALRDLRRRVVSYVGQDPGAALEPTMRVGRTLAETAVRPDLATSALAQLGLPATYVRRRAWELSGGEQRRVALARALLRENPVLLADEPFAGLDHDRRGEVAALLREYSRKHDAAVLISGHDVGFLRAVCDREVAVAPRTPPAPAPAPVETVPSALVRGRGPESETGTEPGPPIFSARGLRASFRGRPVLDGVGLSLSSGEITGLSGPSGSGKTTLARTLAGLRPADEGELVLAGSPLALRSADRSRAQQLRVQLIPQDPASSLNPRRDALGAVSRPARLRGLGKAAAQQLARELIAQVGLPEDCCRRFPGELSGGQRQRVCVARALAAEPLVLLCDEITSALDWDTGCSIVGLLRSIIAERPFAVLFVCHDKRLVEAACDRVLFLADGKLAAARRSR